MASFVIYRTHPLYGKGYYGGLSGGVVPRWEADHTKALHFSDEVLARQVVVSLRNSTYTVVLSEEE